MQDQNLRTPPLVTGDIMSLNNSDQKVKHPTTTHSHRHTYGPLERPGHRRMLNMNDITKLKKRSQGSFHIMSSSLPFPLSPPTPARLGPPGCYAALLPVGVPAHRAEGLGLHWLLHLQITAAGVRWDPHCSSGTHTPAASQQRDNNPDQSTNHRLVAG